MLAQTRRLSGLAVWQRSLLALGLGAIMALGQAPVSWPIAVFLALPPLLWLFDATKRPREAALLGWFAGTGYFAAALFWIVEPFLVDAARHGWMAPFALVFMAGGLALFWAAAFWAARFKWPVGPERVLLLAALWTLAEFARSTVLTGFPWALVAYVWIETPVMQVAAFTGPHLLGFLTLAAGLAPGAAPIRGAVFAVAMVAAAWAAGAARLSAPTPLREEPVVVRILQPNATQALKWRSDMQQVFFDRHLAMSAAPGDPPPDIVIWSETAAPFVIGYDGDLIEQVSKAAGPGAAVILGARSLDATPERESWYNSLAVLSPEGQLWARYDKHHLVPFGEYIPLVSQLEALLGFAPATLTSTGFASGDGPRALSGPGVPAFLPLICYEAIFPHQMIAKEGRPDWIVHITNDAWFGEASGPYQHFAQIRARAIEQGLPVARAANTGISAMIGPRGEVLASLELGAAGHFDAPLPGALPPTFYARFGDLPALAFILIVIGLTYLKFYSSKVAPPNR